MYNKIPRKYVLYLNKYKIENFKILSAIEIERNKYKEKSTYVQLRTLELGRSSRLLTKCSGEARNQ